MACTKRQCIKLVMVSPNILLYYYLSGADYLPEFNVCMQDLGF